jgi:hypothetical protein
MGCPGLYNCGHNTHVGCVGGDTEEIEDAGDIAYHLLVFVRLHQSEPEFKVPYVQRPALVIIDPHIRCTETFLVDAGAGDPNLVTEIGAPKYPVFEHNGTYITGVQLGGLIDGIVGEPFALQHIGE